MESSIGKLLSINERITGVASITKRSNKEFVNILIEPGFYLILDEVVDKKSENIFLEILYENNIILIRMKAILNTKIL